jgi:hypothetical protein
MLKSLAVALLIAATPAIAATRTISISHANTGTRLPAMQMNSGDKLRVEIADTDVGCFVYSVNEINRATAPVETRGSSKVLVIEVDHDAETTGYVIDAELIEPVGDSCKDLRLTSRRWTMEVLSRWRVAISGGIGVDRLESRVYYLDPEVRTVDGVRQEGFVVSRDESAEDEANPLTAVMIHVYRSDWPWMPAALGLSVTGEENRLLFGTGIKLGNRGFVTVGALLGDARRLPTGVKEGQFVTDANLLTDLNTKREFGPFISISLSMWQTDASLFNKMLGR